MLERCLAALQGPWTKMLKGIWDGYLAGVVFSFMICLFSFFFKDE